MADGTTIEIQAQDTTFGRQGTTQQQIVHSPTDGGPTMQTVYGTAPIIQKLPFSRNAVAGTSYLSALFPAPDFETPTTGLYSRTLAVAVALAQSGPTAVRGGTARTGFAIADAIVQVGLTRWREIYAAWVAWAQVTEQAVASYNTIFRGYDQQTLSDNEQDIMAKHANLQGSIGFLGQVNASNQALVQSYAVSRHYGTQTMTTTESLTGLGTQDSAAKNAFGSSNWR